MIKKLLIVLIVLSFAAPVFAKRGQEDAAVVPVVVTPQRTSVQPLPNHHANRHAGRKAFKAAIKRAKREAQAAKKQAQEDCKSGNIEVCLD